MMSKVNVFWFRRDLRLQDNVGLYKALHSKYPVLPIFIFDTEILESLPKKDARLTFIFDTLQELRKELQKHGSSLAMYHGTPNEAFKEVLDKFEVQNVIANHDYEPYATNRDAEISELLKENDIQFFSFKDQVIFEKDEVVKADGDPYVVYTPYMKKWKERFKNNYKLKDYNIKKCLDNFIQHSRLPNLDLSDLGFERSEIEVPAYNVDLDLIQNYEATRNFPAKDGTSHLGPHLRFGTVSVRKMVEKATRTKNEVFWQELIWREFFMQVLWHFPETHKNAFKSKYDRIEWRNNEEEFEKWKNGETGFPLVDAGMRQLNE
ncbi:MAG: deoxyribodipyrimidine photo-lyase, partial [Flavobacteriaceae bacterium]|nr:deoxyribodipyrimidine photo-lyase [Flavobacteriaceae bacterium]